LGRRVATLWHATFSVATGILYFFFVLPRWSELMGESSPTLGTVLRIVAGALIALAALPVVFTLPPTRKPGYGTPQPTGTLRTWSIVAHVLAGALIAGTAISEIWLNLDAVGQWLFGIYGAAAAIAVLGILGFYLSLVAELPPPPKPKKAKPRRPGRKGLGRKRSEKTAEVTVEAAATPRSATDDAESTADTLPTAEDASTEDTAAEDTTVAEEPRRRLLNRRPSGKSSRAHRRTRSRSDGTVED
jgi:hypothetical protein